MNSDEFTAASIAILHSAVGWQTAIARRLGIEARTVRRWVQAGETPPWVDQQLADMMGGVGASPWPRDEWIIGDGVTGDGRRREYIMHVAPPRFVARIVAVDEDDAPEESDLPADIVSGTVYHANPETLDVTHAWHDRALPAIVQAIIDGGDLPDGFHYRTRRDGVRMVGVSR